MRILYILIASLFTTSLFSQVDNKLANTGIKVSYQGAVFYPGFRLGIERPYKIKKKERIFKSFTWTVYKERYLTYNLGTYFHKSFHSNVFLFSEWQIRRQSNFGVFYEIAPGLGFSRTFLPPTFTIDDNGSSKKVLFAGNFYGLSCFSATFGVNLHSLNSVPVKVYWKTSVIALVPYNSLFYYRPTIEFGIVYCNSKFWQAKPKVKHKTKNYSPSEKPE